MDDLMDRVQEMLADPATAARLNGLLGTLPAGDALAPLTGAGKESPHVALLKALRPYLHGDRERQLDEALEMLRLLQLLPLFRQKGGNP